MIDGSKLTSIKKGNFQGKLPRGICCGVYLKRQCTIKILYKVRIDFAVLNIKCAIIVFSE